MDYQALLDDIKRHEGWSPTVYKCPAGRPTIGYGFNLDEGIPEEVADYWLRHIVKKTRDELSGLKEFQELNDVRQNVLINMCFNLGLPRLMKFENMWGCLSDGDFYGAAFEMLDSRWAHQVGPRAEELADKMRAG